MGGSPVAVSQGRVGGFLLDGCPGHLGCVRGAAGVGAACVPEPTVPGHAAPAPEGLCSWEAAHTGRTAVAPPSAREAAHSRADCTHLAKPPPDRL